MKDLKDMSLEELWALFPIILKEHNPDYAMWYEDEKRNLVCILNDYNICRINHIGSTSIKNLIAKPIIDILLELPNNYDMEAVARILQSHDWIVMAKNTVENTIDLNKGYTPNGFAEKVFHLHIKPSGDWGELYFRDYLQKYPYVAHQYEKLKLQLTKKFKYNRDAYTDAKLAFIINFTQKGREEFEELYLPSKP